MIRITKARLIAERLFGSLEKSIVKSVQAVILAKHWKNSFFRAKPETHPGKQNEYTNQLKQEQYLPLTLQRLFFPLY